MKKETSGYFLGIVLAAVYILGVANFNSKQNHEILASVNNQYITSHEISCLVQEKLNTDDKSKITQIVYDTFYESLADLILSEEAARLGIEIPLEQAKNKLYGNSKFIDASGHFSFSLLEEYLNNRGAKTSSYIQEIAHRMGGEELRRAICHNLKLPDKAREWFVTSKLRKRSGFYQKWTNEPYLDTSDIQNKIREYYDRECHKLADTVAEIEGFTVHIDDLIQIRENDINEILHDHFNYKDYAAGYNHLLPEIMIYWNNSVKWKKFSEKCDDLKDMLESNVDITALMKKSFFFEEKASSLKLITPVSIDKKFQSTNAKKFMKNLSLNKEEQKVLLDHIFDDSKDKIKHFILPNQSVVILRVNSLKEDIVLPFEDIKEDFYNKYIQKEKRNLAMIEAKEYAKNHGTITYGWEKLSDKKFDDVDKSTELGFLYDELFKMSLNETRVVEKEDEIYVLYYDSYQDDQYEDFSKQIDEALVDFEKEYQNTFIYAYTDQLIAQHNVEIHHNRLNYLIQRYCESAARRD